MSGIQPFQRQPLRWSKDLGGDSILPSAVARTLADRAAGRLTWLLTDSHSTRGSDVVAVVDSAVADSRRVRVEGRWADTDAGQRLRTMARDGIPLGLSIDYLVRKSRPDGAGGRTLTDIEIVDGAVVTAPANPQCVIVSSKDAGLLSGPVVGVYEDAQARRADPDADRRRRREDAMLAAVSWPPPHFPRETRLALLADVAGAKARRDAQGDPERAQAEAKRDRANAYSNALAWTMAHATSCGVCWFCQAGGAGIQYG